MSALVVHLQPRQQAPCNPADPLYAVTGRILRPSVFSIEPVARSLDRLTVQAGSIAENARRLLSLATAVAVRLSLHRNHDEVQRCAITQPAAGRTSAQSMGEKA